eukprot:1153291-Pelagomonas_calceolata.AAC.2
MDFAGAKADTAGGVQEEKENKVREDSPTCPAAHALQPPIRRGHRRCHGRCRWGLASLMEHPQRCLVSYGSGIIFVPAARCSSICSTLKEDEQPLPQC